MNKFHCFIVLLTVSAANSLAQNLVTNGNFDLGNSGFVSDYSYSPANMIPGGTYCVVDNPAMVHFAWSPFGDHTTGTGLMLVVNGDPISSSNAVWRETIPVTPGHGYQFSFWAASSHDDTPAQFEIRISDHTVLTTPQLPATTGSWVQFRSEWKADTSATAQIEILLANTTIGATDFVVDDVAFTVLPTVDIQPAVQVNWLSASNVSYQVQWSTNLNSTQWFNFGAPIIGNGGTNSICDPVRYSPTKYYRVIPLD